MKAILGLILLFILNKVSFSQNDYYNQFDLCNLPFQTQNLFTKYNDLKKEYNTIPKEHILKYIGSKEGDIRYYYDMTNFDTGESTATYDEYIYYYLYKFSINNLYFTSYIKSQNIFGSILLTIYLQSYNDNFIPIDKLKLHEFIPDMEIIRSIIYKDNTIKIFKYNPIENFKKVKISIFTYKINSNGNFDLIKTEEKKGNKDFISYIDSNKNPEDDPYGK